MIHVSFHKECKVCGRDLTEWYDSFFTDSIYTLRRDCCTPLNDEEQALLDADQEAWRLQHIADDNPEDKSARETFAKAYARYMELYSQYVKKHRPLMNMSG